jgi:histone demethylase JARID1
MFDALTEDPDLYSKEETSGGVSYEALAAEALNTAGEALDEKLADQFLAP